MNFLLTYQELCHLRAKKHILDLLNNNLTFTSSDGNLEVAWLDRDKGIASKWRSWWEVRESPKWLPLVNNRLIAREEIVLDLDPLKKEPSEAFNTRIIYTIRRVKADGAKIMGCFNTGSRGVHIHFILPELGLYSTLRIEQMKRRILQEYGGDIQKCSCRCMIAVESTPHWKTHQRKEIMSL